MVSQERKNSPAKPMTFWRWDGDMNHSGCHASSGLAGLRKYLRGYSEIASYGTLIANSMSRNLSRRAFGKNLGAVAITSAGAEGAMAAPQTAQNANQSRPDQNRNDPECHLRLVFPHRQDGRY